MANITRNQFDPTKGVLRKVLQRGVFLLDSDWNEQMDVLQDETQKALGISTHNDSSRIGDGFKITNAVTPPDDEVTIKAGWGIFKLSDGRSIALKNESDMTAFGFSPFAGGPYTDYVYIDIFIDEIDSSEDANIVNPDIGQETCVDQRVSWTIEISQNTAPPAPPADHYYIVLATVLVETNDKSYTWKITNTLSDWTAILENFWSGNILKNSRFNVNDGVTSEDWVVNGGAGYAITQTQGTFTKFGGLAAQCIGGGLAGSYNAEQLLGEEVAKALRGKKIRFGVWVAGSADGAERVTIIVNDGIGASSENTDMGTLAAGTFRLIEVEHTVNSSASSLKVIIEAQLNATVYTWYMDAAYLYVGDTPDRVWEPSFHDRLQPTKEIIDNLLADDVVILYTSKAESFTDADSVILKDVSIEHTVTDPSAAGTTRIIIRIPYFHHKAIKKIGVSMACESSGGGTGQIRIGYREVGGSVESVFGLTSIVLLGISDSINHVEMDVSGRSVRSVADAQIWIHLTATGTAFTLTATRVVIYGLKE